MQTMSASSTTRPPGGPAMARQEWRQALAAFDAAMERYENAIKAHARALEQAIEARRARPSGLFGERRS